MAALVADVRTLVGIHETPHLALLYEEIDRRCANTETAFPNEKLLDT